MNANDQTTALHGDAAMAQVVDPKPPRRSQMWGFTVRAPKPKPPVDVPRRRLPVKASRPVDGIPAMTTRPPLRAAPPRAGGGLMVDGREDHRTVQVAPVPVYGPVAILAELARHGVTVALSADRLHVVPTATGGRFIGRDQSTFTSAAPLLLAHLRGEPLVCQVGPHPKGTPADAVTILVGECPCCLWHLNGGKEGSK